MIPTFQINPGTQGAQVLLFSLTLADAGGGAVYTQPIMSVGDGTATFTRATTAWTKLASGLWASVASGTARSSYLGADTTVGAYGGYFAEGARTNDCLQARDLTTTWVAGATATVAKDAVGIDGVTNSASTITGGAVAGTNIVTQAITLGSSADTFSCFIKRLVGSGTISITLDNATYTDITSQINASTYTRVQIQQTLANPTVGIKVTTSGDKVAVDMCQMEPGGFASSPIPTTTVAVTRNADVLTYALTGNIVATQGSCYAEIAVPTISGSSPQIISSQGGEPLEIKSGTNLAVYDVTAERSGNAISGSASVQKVASSWGGSTCNTFLAGVASSNLTFDGDLSLATSLNIASLNDGAQSLNGCTKNNRIYSVALPAAALQAMTT